MARRSAWIEPVSEIAMVPVAECNWPTVTSVGVTASPSLSASTPWLNKAAASNDRANSGVERINRDAMGRLLCNEGFSMAAVGQCGYTQPDVTEYVI